MNNRFRLHLSQSRGFWLLRSTLRNIFFGLGARIYNVRYRLNEGRSNYQVIRHLCRITWALLLICIVVAASLQTIDSYLYSYYGSIGIAIPDDSDYVTLLATISGIGGVFIGLYYAGLSMVGSTTYAKVPNNIRDLLAHEKFGNVYMGFLAFLTFLGLILIAFRVMGFPRVHFAIPLVTILAGIGIISFVQLGQRAFYFFDPTALSQHIFKELQRWLSMVVIGGFRWQDRSFQNHAHKRASATLDTLKTLSDITSKEPHLNGKPFIELSKNILKFLIVYEDERRIIPTESVWYQQQYQHRDWYRTDDTAVALAHQTSTMIQPEMTTNNEWIEERCIPIVKRCIEVNLVNGRYTDLFGLFDYTEVYIKKLAREGSVDRAFVLIENLVETVLDQFTKQTDSNLQGTLEQLGLVERLSALTISVALNYRETIEGISCQHIENMVSSVRWDKEASIYRQGFSKHCLSRVEWLNPRLAFERQVEGHVVSSLWYLTELVRQVEAKQFVANIETLIIKSSDLFKTSIKKATDGNQPWLAAAIMSREHEYWHKISDQLNNIWPKTWDELSSERYIDGLPWSLLDLEELRSRSDARQNELLSQMSKQNILLALVDRPEDYPDYAGQFLHTSGEVAFDALLKNDTALLKNVFKPYLHGALLKFDKLKPTTSITDWHAQQDFKIAAAPLLDLMNLSGYAKLMSDYHENVALWEAVKQAWDKCLNRALEQSPLPLLAGALDLTEGSFGIPHRAVLRTTWKQKITNLLKNIPRREVCERDMMLPDTEIDHESVLVRIFADEFHVSLYDGIDVFINFYLRNCEGGESLDFGTRRRHFPNALQRAEQRDRDVLRNSGGEE